MSVKASRKKRSFSLASYVMTGFFMAISFGLTLFIFANSFELAFNYDIPFVGAISSIHLEGIETGVHDQQALGQSRTQEREGGFGAPFAIKLPIQKVRLPLVLGVLTPQGWLARANAGHYFITTPSKNNNLGTLVVYVAKSWRTIPDPQDLRVGDNMFVDTNRDWRYMYRIETIDVFPFGKEYVIEDTLTSKMVMVIEDASQHVHYIVSASIVSVQNIQQ